MQHQKEPIKTRQECWESFMRIAGREAFEQAKRRAAEKLRQEQEQERAA